MALNGKTTYLTGNCDYYANVKDCDWLHQNCNRFEIDEPKTTIASNETAYPVDNNNERLLRKEVYRTMNSFASKAVVTALACCASAAASAQEPMLEEVIVTAQKRAESLQDVPVSINVVSGDKLKEANITKLEDLQAYVPNLTMSETGIGTNVYMRGIGSGINQGFEQSVGTYVDNVYYGRAQLSRAPFLDLERVEVLRGPQNILYGKNSIAGALVLTTAKPKDEFAGFVSATYEPSLNEKVLDGVVTGPITDNLQYRVAYRSRTMDGFIKNIDGNDEPSRDEDTLRLQLAWQPNSDSNINFKYEQGTFDVKGRQIEIINDQPGASGATWSQFLAQVGGSRVQPSVLNTSVDFKRGSNGDYSNNDSHNYTLEATYDLGGYEISSTTSSLDYKYDELCDCDFTSANIFFVNSNEEYKQLSQEFRITSPGNQTIDWVAGVYYQDQELDFYDAFFADQDSLIGDILDTVLAAGPFAGVYPTGGAQVLNGFAAPRNFVQSGELFSGFAQATWNINDRQRLTIGGRYSEETKEATRTLDFVDDNGNVLDFDDRFIPNGTMGVDYLLARVLNVTRQDLTDGFNDNETFAPAINYQFDISDDAMTYINWSQGFKAAGYDVRSNRTINPQPISNPWNDDLAFTPEPGTFAYDEEKSTTIEAGLKTRFAGGAAELNIAVFHTKFEDLQVSIYDGVLGFNVGNAAKATSEGIELDGRWAMTDHLTLIGALAFLDFEFNDYANGQCTQAVRIARLLEDNTSRDCSYDGLTNQYVADYSGSFTLDYGRSLTSSLDFNSALDVIFTSEYHPTQNLDASVQQGGYTKFNFRTSIANSDGDWEVAILGKNLTDEKVVTYAADAPLSSNLVQSVGHYGFVEPGRTIALQGTYNF